MMLRYRDKKGHREHSITEAYMKLLLLSLSLWSSATAQYCSPSDYKFEYTECGVAGERWRVAVPAAGSKCANLPPPSKGLNCTSYCSTGQYLDLDSQQCRECAPGTYSLGGGVRFEEFVTLPQGFSIETFDVNLDHIMDSSPQTTMQPCSPETGWLVQDGDIQYISTACVSRMSLSATLVRPGFVEFTYRMPRNNKAFSMQVDVRNQQCQSYSDLLATRQRKPNEESNGEWHRRKVELRSGTNVITWTVTNNAMSQQTTESIRITRIDIVGLAFTRKCSLCPEGTYSGTGAFECVQCEAGYFAPKGATECGKCPQTEYSGPKSGRCEKRPPCRKEDFYPVTEPCSNERTRTVYKMVQPAVCREDIEGAFKLPPPGPYRACPKCNPGMEKDANGICAFCPPEHFSDGNACQRCPVDTVPNYGMQYVRWNVMPPSLSTRCEYIGDDVVSTCDIGESWLASGESLISAPSLQRGIALELVVDIKQGFHNPFLPHGMSVTAQNPIATLTVVFEMQCFDSSCGLFFIEDSRPGMITTSSYRVLVTFNGSQPRRVWSYSILRSAPARFLIAFVRSKSTAGEDSITDQARILSINITNVAKSEKGVGRGASQCVACPRGASGGCVACPPGHYMHAETHECTRCGKNSIAVADKDGGSSCVACGENLISTDGVVCKSDGKWTVKKDNRTLAYDLASWTNRTWIASGVKVFAREGTSYYHQFNMSLIGAPVTCREDFESNSNFNSYVDSTGPEEATGAACRLTAIPSNKHNASAVTLFTPLLLATRLEAITINTTFKGWNLTNSSLEYEGLDAASLPLDVHLWHDVVGSSSDACPKGNSFVATLRCSPNKKNPELRLPHACPDGTCDGCLYHVIVESSQACPVCNAGDYDVIRGECVNGQQTIHYIPDKHCVLSGKEAATRTAECSVLSTQQKAMIGLGLVALLVLSLVLFVICRRNRRLEYKYTRLIESRTGELPAAETCGLESDEDDDELTDRVIFSKKRSPKGEENAAFVPLQNED